jgi:hypothetical protein
MTADVFYTVAEWLTVALAVAVVGYVWTHPELLAKLRKHFHDALDEAGGPPESHA